MDFRSNRRRYFRVKPDNPICAEVTITQVGNRITNVGKKFVCIQDISAGGLCFLSELNFPVNPNIILEFHINILKNDIQVLGCIVRKVSMSENTFEYGIQFIGIDESDRINLIRILNNVLIRIKNKAFISNCSTCKLRNDHIIKSINKSINSFNISAYKSFYNVSTEKRLPL